MLKKQAKQEKQERQSAIDSGMIQQKGMGKQRRRRNELERKSNLGLVEVRFGYLLSLLHQSVPPQIICSAMAVTQTFRQNAACESKYHRYSITSYCHLNAGFCLYDSMVNFSLRMVELSEKGFLSLVDCQGDQQERRSRNSVN